MNAGGVKVFISYRRQDSSSTAGRIYDRLVGEFGRTNVFFDVDAIPLGVDFGRFIEESVAQSDVVLVLIGKRWLTARDDEGRRRLENERDFVRLEIEAALKHGIPLVPVLVEEGKLPRSSDLPPPISELVNRNGTSVRRDPDFHPDVDRLINGIKSLLPSRSSTAEHTAPSATPALSDVVLIEVGPLKISVIKAVRELTGLGLKEAKDLVDATPSIVLQQATTARAETARKLLIEAGATVDERPASLAASSRAQGPASRRDVVLVDPGPQKIMVIKIVRELTGLGLKEAKDLVDATPSIVLRQAVSARAEVARNQLEEAGARCRIA